MRHSAISILLQQGVPVPTVARLAGHDPSMTLRVYAHADLEAVEAAVAHLGSLYGTR